MVLSMKVAHGRTDRRRTDGQTDGRTDATKYIISLAWRSIKNGAPPPHLIFLQSHPAAKSCDALALFDLDAGWVPPYFRGPRHSWVWPTIS